MKGNGVDPVGNMHIKDWARIQPGHPDYGPDTPDTAEEAATWLAVNFVARAPEAVEVAAIEPEASDEAHGETGAENAVDNAPPVLAERPSDGLSDLGTYADNAGAESVDEFASATELTPDEVAVIESQAADEAPEEVAGAVDSGNESATEGDDGGAENGAAGGGLALYNDDGSPRAGDSDRDYAYDADFEEIGEPEVASGEHPEFPGIEPPFGAPIEHDRAFEQPSGGVVYFGDDIHVARLAKLGRLAEIARERKALLQDGWTVSEFASLQNLIVRIERQEAPDDPEGRARFLAISERSRGMNTIDAYQNQREDELEQYAELLKGEDTREAGRAAITAFNPEEGWPE